MSGLILPSGETLIVSEYFLKERNNPHSFFLQSDNKGMQIRSSNLYIKNFPSPHFDEFDLQVRLLNL